MELKSGFGKQKINFSKNKNINHMPKSKRECRVLITLDLDTSRWRTNFRNVSAYYKALDRQMRNMDFRKRIGSRRLTHNTYCSVHSEYGRNIIIVDLINEIRDSLDIHNIFCTKIFGCKFKIRDCHLRRRNRRRQHGNRRR